MVKQLGEEGLVRCVGRRRCDEHALPRSEQKPCRCIANGVKKRVYEGQRASDAGPNDSRETPEATEEQRAG